MSARLPREHGTPRGLAQHYHYHDDPCGPCAEAGRVAQQERRDAARAEQEARRQRWQEQDQQAEESI